MTYLRRRLLERSTLAAISAGVASAALIPSPYSWICIFIAVVQAMLPDGRVGGGQ